MPVDINTLLAQAACSICTFPPGAIQYAQLTALLNLSGAAYGGTQAPQQATILPVSTAVPRALAAVSTPVGQVFVFGMKSPRTNNATDMWMGPQAADGTQPTQIIPGGIFSFAGIDLSQWYIDITTPGDGAVIVYW